MKRKLKLIVPIFFLTFLFTGCNKEPREIKKGFYMWQSNHYDETKDQELFREFESQVLYIKLFEVAFNDLEGAVPIAKTNVTLHEFLIGDAEIIPCIYIENDVLNKLSDNKIETLSDNILFLTDKYFKEKLFDSPHSTHDFKEIQIDCDWTKSTKKNYFNLLSTLKNKSKKRISCTMRLYPYKYNTEMGIPPVDRVMLLCYNLLNPVKNVDKNTILEIEELKKYIDIEHTYPIPVDVALPVYSSAYRYQNDRFQGVFHAVPKEIDSVLIPLESKFHYVVEKDTFLGEYLHKGEKLKIERVKESELLKASQLLDQHIDQKKLNVVLYHLDHEELKQYDHEKLDSIFSIFK